VTHSLEQDQLPRLGEARRVARIVELAKEYGRYGHLERNPVPDLS